MPLDNFDGKWGVMTSGRADKLPAGHGEYLCIYTKGKADDTWVLKTWNGTGEPAPFGNLLFQGYEGRDGGVQRIYCTVTFPEGEYYFEAVLARQLVNDKPLIYGHLYPRLLSHCYEGEGAVGGWSADRQGDPPTHW